MRIEFAIQYKVFVCLFAQHAVCAFAAPSAEQLGEILGYPANEIIVQDITDHEQKLWVTPTLRERRRATPLPDPQLLLSAYKVSGKKSSSFYSMLIWIGKEGAFHNASTQKILDLIASGEAKPVIEGGREPFGPLTFGELGEGGIYLGKIKVPSTSQEMQVPQHETAMISILHLPSQSIDVRIAFVASLGGGADLTPLPGGEKYYEAFRPPKEGEVELRYDIAGLFLALNQLILAESDLGSSRQADSLFQSQPETELNNSAAIARKTAHQTQKVSGSWTWMVFAVLIGGVVCFVYFHKKRR